MISIINSEWALNEKGHPIKAFVYLVTEDSVLPEDAPVGSRAVDENGMTVYKTPSGWKR